MKQEEEKPKVTRINARVAAVEFREEVQAAVEKVPGVHLGRVKLPHEKRFEV
jgi:hypothetical protein